MEAGQVVDKKVELELVGLDGNAFALMGAFQKQARREGWSKEDIDKVLEECRASDYNHLVATLAAHCEEPEEEWWIDPAGGYHPPGEIDPLAQYE